jgi:hypothetical protein
VVAPGALSDAPFAVEALLFFTFCSDVFCIFFCADEYSEESEDFILSLCANAEVATSRAAIAAINGFSIGLSFVSLDEMQRPECTDVPVLPDGLTRNVVLMNSPSSSRRNFVLRWRRSQAGLAGDSINRRVLSSLAAYAAANPPRGRCAKTKSFSIISN